jgi:hypothetical protein
MAFQLPSGPQSNSYQISLYVIITDDSDGYAQFNLPTNAIVQPNNELVQNLANSLTGSNSGGLMQSLKTGSLQSTSNFVNSLVLMIDSANVANNTNNNVNQIKL